MVKLKEKVNFAGQHIYVGMDVHLRSWSIAIVYERQYIRKFSQPPSVEALYNTLTKDYPGASFFVAYEAGFCGFGIQRKLNKLGINCIVVNAADIPKTDKEKKNKTDSIDARSIAENLSAAKLTAIHIPNEKTESDRQLVRSRLSILRDLQRTKNRIKSALYFKGIPIPEKFDNATWSKAFVQWLKDIETNHPSGKLMLKYLIGQMEWQRSQLLQITRDARAILKETDYGSQAELLLSVPGIGPLNAVTLLTEIGDIKRFTRAIHFNSFLGLCPTEHSTGENEHKGGLTVRCNNVLRPLIVEAAWVAIRHDPALMLAFNNYRKNNISPKRAIIKIAHKLQ
jgi:transposase